MRRMKKIYQIISILLAVCLLTGIVGCRKKEQKADAKYTIYQINQSGTALVPKDYDGTGKSVDEEVKGMLSALQKCDDEVKAQAALPKKVKLERYTLEDEKLILYYNAAYGKMDTVREVLCRAALVRSLMYRSPHARLFSIRFGDVCIPLKAAVLRTFKLCDSIGLLLHSRRPTLINSLKL